MQHSFDRTPGPLASGSAHRGASPPATPDQPWVLGTADIIPSRWDSDLEAFSHNPTDGSFAPLAPQPSTRTKCLNLQFLSY